MQREGKNMSDTAIEDMVLDLSHITTAQAIVHSMPYAGTRGVAVPSFRIADTASLSMKDIPSYEGTVITATAPLAGQELEASREELAQAIASMRDEAATEGGDGFLLGYDPLNPTARIPASELALGADCVFVWNRERDEGPIFEWSEVAHLVTSREHAHIFLVDGRLISLCADIDWWNRLS